MKVSIIALFAAPALVLGALAPQSGPAAVAHHHQNIARGIKAHPASHYAKRGPAKARRCAAKTASLSIASVSSTSVLAKETTTTTKKADPTTTTKKPDPTTTTKKPDPTTTPKPKPTADSNNNDSGSGQTYTGDATFYATGLNACGTVDQDSDYIAALAHGAFDSYPGANGNPNENPICNKKVRACYEGNCVTVRITDRCGGCVGDALDFSPSAFKQLASPDLGRVHGMTWQYV
jgi:hypothetical protein